MGYLCLFCVAIMFSFVGSCAKLIQPYFSSNYIAFFRFFFGVLFLILLKLLRKERFEKGFLTLVRENLVWLVFGGVSKCLAYLFENYALTRGNSYGNIVTQPAQTVFLTLVSVLLFHEKLSFRKVICIIMCLGGVLCISWNGIPLSTFVEGQNLLLMIVFIISGICGACHILSQKMVVNKMSNIDGNLSTFIFSLIMSTIVITPSTLRGEIAGVTPNLACILAAIFVGFITAFAFFLNAKAIPLVPFYMVPIIQCSSVIFMILWGVVFFKEEVSAYVIGGTIVFIVGLIFLQLPDKKTSLSS